MRHGPADGQEGFSFIELLVVIIILSVLAAIALATYLGRRDDAFDRQAWSDLRNSALLMESYFVDNGTYVGAPGTAEFTESSGVTIQVGASTLNTFCLEADHESIAGSGTIDWHYSNAVGRAEPGACP